MTLELVCGADFWCNRHCATSPVDLEGFWGQVWPGNDHKLQTIGKPHKFWTIFWPLLWPDFAVWPDLFWVGNRSFWGSGRPRGPGKAFKNVGAKPPTDLKAFAGPRGRPDLKNAPQKSGQIAFRSQLKVNFTVLLLGG